MPTKQTSSPVTTGGRIPDGPQVILVTHSEAALLAHHREVAGTEEPTDLPLEAYERLFQELVSRYSMAMKDKIVEQATAMAKLKVADRMLTLQLSA